jgi:hypothetical protein
LGIDGGKGCRPQGVVDVRRESATLYWKIKIIDP